MLHCLLLGLCGCATPGMTLTWSVNFPSTAHTSTPLAPITAMPVTATPVAVPTAQAPNGYYMPHPVLTVPQPMPPAPVPLPRPAAEQIPIMPKTGPCGLAPVPQAQVADAHGGGE